MKQESQPDQSGLPIVGHQVHIYLLLFKKVSQMNRGRQREADLVEEPVHEVRVVGHYGQDQARPVVRSPHLQGVTANCRNLFSVIR